MRIELAELKGLLKSLDVSFCPVSRSYHTDATLLSICKKVATWRDENKTTYTLGLKLGLGPAHGAVARTILMPIRLLLVLSSVVVERHPA